MNEEKRVDALLRFAEASSASMGRRQQFEWKVSFGLWTALAAFSALVVRGEVPLFVSSRYTLGLAIILVIILVVYIFVWLSGLAARQKRDRGLAEEYWRMAEEALNINVRSNFPDPATRFRWKLLRSLHSKYVWRNWSHLFQILVTLLLAILALWSVLSAANGPG